MSAGFRGASRISLASRSKGVALRPAKLVVQSTAASSPGMPTAAGNGRYWSLGNVDIGADGMTESRPEPSAPAPAVPDTAAVLGVGAGLAGDRDGTAGATLSRSSNDRN